MARILLIEDERSIREALRFELEEEGYEIYHTSDFYEAVNMVKTFSIDLIISDIFFQNGNGFQLMNHIQDIQNNIPFIMMTAYPESELAHHIRDILDDRFFEKPFFIGQIKQKISEIMNLGLRSKEKVFQVAY